MKSILTFLILFGSVILFSQQKENQWQTIFEKSGGISTADYNESIEYFQNIADHSQIAEMYEFGVTPQGRKLYYLVVNKNGNYSPEQNEKPVVFVQNGIHSGEIEGKDASMLLLREILITEEKKNIIENLTLIVIPVLNADGHERKSKYNRINQNGPEEMGWRTTAHNYNLNRDYTKADAPEMQALLKLFTTWLPEVYIDNHTTNGLDFQYVLTYGIEKYQNTRSVLADWTRNEFIPYFENTLNEREVLTAPYFWYLERGNVSTGVTDWVSTPRFSHGYAAYQNRIGLLIETHMLKPYDDRVFATKEAMEVVLEYVNENSDRIVEMVSAADTEAIDEYYHKGKALPIEFKSTSDYDDFIFKGFKPVVTESFITGTNITTYSNEKFTDTIKYYSYKQVVDSITLPKAYIIPQEWGKIVDKVLLHGIKVEKLDKEKEFNVEKYKFYDIEFAQNSYEGRQRVSADYEVIKEKVKTNIGDYVVFLNQRNAPLIGYLLEPKTEDSFLRWGFMNQIFERKEYFEYYSMQPIADEILNNNPPLKEEFLKKLESDENFKNNPYARMNFFYEQTPYFDEKYNVYPILRVVDEL